jgi:hypothetical protein
MSHDLSPFDQNYSKRGTAAEELDAIRNSKFKFGCLGINCLGWVLIILLLLMLYLARRYNILSIMV